MKYQLTKLASNKFRLSQGDDPKTNRLKTIFTSAKSARNFARHRNPKNEVYIAGTNVKVTDSIAKSLDVVKFEDEIRENFPDVASVKTKDGGKRTIVVLKDGRKGSSMLQDDDVQDRMVGFLYAFRNARKKSIDKDNMVIDVCFYNQVLRST